MKIDELYEIYLQYPSIETDTRKLKKGDLFVALKGLNFNGNEFAQKAIDAGAAYAVIDEQKYASDKTILVEDALLALQQLAHHHRRLFPIPFIAITGSNGKTTTKELIRAVLSSSYKTYTTEGNLNNHIGVPLTILKIKRDAQMAVIEMGANHQKEIASYCKIAEPTHGLITNCGKAHLEGFGSEEGVKKAKGELYDHLRENDGIAFIMWDYDYLRQMSKEIPTVFKYGTAGADIIGETIENDPYLSVKFISGYQGNINTQLVGSYNLPNVLAAVATGKYFDVEEEKIRKAIENYVPSNSRSQLIQKGTNTIILDAYNANPSSMQLAIENFANAKNENKILALGSMAELGESSLQEHANIIQLIGKHTWKHVILVGKNFNAIQHSYMHFSFPEEACAWLKKQNLTNTYFLIKGSRSTEMEKVLEAF